MAFFHQHENQAWEETPEHPYSQYMGRGSHARPEKSSNSALIT